MSMENFFTSTKKKDSRRRGGKSNANATPASQDHEHGDSDDAARGASLADEEETNGQRDDLIVEKVTTNIATMLDSKLAVLLKPVNELSEKFNTLFERIGSVEQRVSDLEDTATATTPRLDT